jgi:hypothetical protein
MNPYGTLLHVNLLVERPEPSKIERLQAIKVASAFTEQLNETLLGCSLGGFIRGGDHIYESIQGSVPSCFFSRPLRMGA